MLKQLSFSLGYLKKKNHRKIVLLHQIDQCEIKTHELCKTKSSKRKLNIWLLFYRLEK